VASSDRFLQVFILGFMSRLLVSVMVPALLVAAPMALLLFTVERQPAAPTGTRISYAEIKHAHRLLARYDPRKMPTNRTTVMRATERDLKAAFAGGIAALPRLGGTIAITPYGVTFTLTGALPVPSNPLGRYVNLRLTVAPSPKGLVISRFALGKIEIPTVIVDPGFRLLFDQLIGPGWGKAMMESVQSVTVAGKTVSVTVLPPKRLVENLTTAARRIAFAGDPAKVRPYYRKLARLSRDRTKEGPSSLAMYIRPLFSLARDRSENGNPVAENRAAILALALYFGDTRFAQMIGKVGAGERHNDRPSAGKARLAGRRDLVRHFTVSAGLALLGGDSVAGLLGEAKEVQDSIGGSGFSFADLAADRAGVRFARSATVSAASARRFQAAFSRRFIERDLFPRSLDLPEGLNEAAFRRRYRDINHPDYDRLIAEIDRRIDVLPLYR